MKDKGNIVIKIVIKKHDTNGQFIPMNVMYKLINNRSEFYGVYTSHLFYCYFCCMAENYRRPTNSNGPISFSFETEGETYSGTLTPSGKPPAFGMPNTFILRMTGKPTMTISIYMGKWVIQGTPAFMKALSEWINDYYRS